MEVNPGPEGDDSPPTVISLAQAFLNMEVAHTAILAELKAIRAAQNNLEGIMYRLSSRIDDLEKSDNAHQSHVDGFVPNSGSCLNKLTSVIKTLAVKCDMTRKTGSAVPNQFSLELQTKKVKYGKNSNRI